jgi:Uma2 family endonuclease
MSLPQLKHPGYTIKDWETWEGRWELIHGMPYAMTPAPNPDHQRISVRILVALFSALKEAKQRTGDGPCEVFNAPIDLYLPGEASVYQPDLVVVGDPAQVTARGIEGIPSLVVEILSPGTASKDWSTKRWAYETAGIPEYLIVDPAEQVGVLLVLQDGRYSEAVRVAWGTVVALLGGRVPITLE